MNFVSQLYMAFLLFDRAKTYSATRKVKYRLNFATISAQKTEDVMLNSNQSARFHYKTIFSVRYQ